jgi:alpha-L-rhamnosidase
MRKQSKLFIDSRIIFNLIISSCFIITALLSCSESKNIYNQKKTEGSIAPDVLKCESRVNPLGIDISEPRLSWILFSTKRGAKQTAYKILVSSSEELLAGNKGDLWDSGKIKSDETLEINYEGKPLASNSKYYWKVRVWDQNDAASEWSEPAIWEMGLTEQDDWQAVWINDGKSNPEKAEDFYKNDPAPLFRKPFEVQKPIKRARLYISGLGYYLSYLNGNRIGDHELDPGWTNYSKRIFYSTYDVSDLVKKGSNCLGVTVGNGWYNPLPLLMWGARNIREALPTGRPRFICQLFLEFEDGSTENIISDDTWKFREGPVLRNSIFLGEIYDARKEIEGWNEPGLDEKDWKIAELAPQISGTLKSQPQPPIKITSRIKPKNITEPATGTYIFDMGENFAGIVKLKVKANRGTSIKMRYGELLNEDGTLNPLTSVAGQIKGKREGQNGNIENIGGEGSPEIAWQTDTYITKGGELEEFIPKFTFHGFRYVEVTGLDFKPDKDMIEGLRLNSDIEPLGTFSCSDPLLNKIQEITKRTFLSNIFSVQSDCPHREKFGYGGDIAVSSEAFIYNYDMLSFYSKTVTDWKDAALENGMLTDTAPFVGIQYCGVGWAMVHPLLQLQLYQYYGNKKLIEENYSAAKEWLELVTQENPDHLIQSGLSDHESLTENPEEVMITPLYYQSVKIMQDLAEILELPDDVEEYRALGKEIKKVYLRKYYDKGSGKVGHGTQGSQSFALYTGILREDQNKRALDYLAQDIRDKHQGHLSTGIFGTKFMLDELSKNGQHDLALEIVKKTDFPGWGYMIENGATTLWEHWAYSDNTYSHNHPMFGSVSEWFYKWLGGIQPHPKAVGFNRIVIRPQTKGSISWVKSSYRSVKGMITSNWEKNDHNLTMNIEIPPNTEAEVYIPAQDINNVEESGRPLSKAEGVTYLTTEQGKIKCKVLPGRYSFKTSI